MISNPWALAAVLIALVFAVIELEKRKVLPRLFHYLPVPFWCYFLPMLLGTAGLLPEKSPVYSFITTYLLASCLILLLLNVNIPRVLRLGPSALGALAVGTLGIGLGAVISYGIFASRLPAETWKAVGSLTGSWTGGSANMLAIKESLQTPEDVFAPMVIVDTLITYLWMGIMIALAVMQDRWDKWVRADRSTLNDVVKRLEGLESGLKSSNAPVWHAAWLIGAGLLLGEFCLRLSHLDFLPAGTLRFTTATYFLITLVGIILSLTPAARVERYGASRWGYACLYLLLAAMGSKAHLQSILQAPLLIVMAVVWVAIHALLLAAYGYWRRVPMFFLAASSQANIGGTASAPIVAGIYQPQLAPIGLLLALAANVYGTYFGYWVAHACKQVGTLVTK